MRRALYPPAPGPRVQPGSANRSRRALARPPVPTPSAISGSVLAARSEGTRQASAARLPQAVGDQTDGRAIGQIVRFREVPSQYRTYAQRGQNERLTRRPVRCSAMDSGAVAMAPRPCTRYAASAGDGARFARGATHAAAARRRSRVGHARPSRPARVPDRPRDRRGVPLPVDHPLFRYSGPILSRASSSREPRWSSNTSRGPGLHCGPDPRHDVQRAPAYQRRAVSDGRAIGATWYGVAPDLMRDAVRPFDPDAAGEAVPVVRAPCRASGPALYLDQRRLFTRSARVRHPTRCASRRPSARSCGGTSSAYGGERGRGGATAVRRRIELADAAKHVLPADSASR